MANVQDPAIAQAYENVRSDKSPETWLIIDYTSEKSSDFALTATGTGDLAEFTEALVKPGNASFGYVRVKYANDEHSFREKFVLVQYIGPEVKVMRRARVSVHTADVKHVLKAYSIEISASSAEDLKEDGVVTLLRKAGGANYDRSSFA